MDDDRKNIAILGWGSLKWDIRPEFSEQHGVWQPNGPDLELEFSRVSESRNGALTLVIAPGYGRLCRVEYTLSRRRNPDDAICDLRCREGTTLDNIGFYFADGSKSRSRHPAALEAVGTWASKNNIDVVVWTDLKCNCETKSNIRKKFTVDNAISHICALDGKGLSKAIEYFRRAPKFVTTPLRDKVELQPWFQNST